MARALQPANTLAAQRTPSQEAVVRSLSAGSCSQVSLQLLQVRQRDVTDADEVGPWRRKSKRCGEVYTVATHVRQVSLHYLPHRYIRQVLGDIIHHFSRQRWS